MSQKLEAAIAYNFNMFCYDPNLPQMYLNVRFLETVC